MATSFDRWEKDPFFPAAEEVQDSADRMESVYRRWVQEGRGGGASAAAATGGELRLDVHTALGTAKWQLDELERAVKSSDNAVSAGKDTRARHNDFVSAIGYRILEVENFLKESSTAEGHGPLSWVHLDEGERDELALFLTSDPVQQQEEVITIPSVGDIKVGSKSTRVKNNVSVDSLKDLSGSAEFSSVIAKEDMVRGHRRVASAYADIGSWTISIPNGDGSTTEESSNDMCETPLPKSPSSSVLMSALQSKPRLKYKNGARKCAGVDQQDAEESIPLRNTQLCQGFDGCYERCKSCLSTCDVDLYNKNLYGCLGALRRQLQRSQYQVQYGCRVQLIVLAVAIFLSFIFAFRTIW